MSPWLGCLKGDFCQAAEHRRKGLKCGIWKQWQHSHQELTWQCLHSSCNDHNPCSFLSGASQCGCWKGSGRRWILPILHTGKPRHRGMGWLDPNHQWGIQKENPRLWHPDQFFIVRADSSELAVGQPVTHRAAVTKGKVSSRNYFHLKLNPWEYWAPWRVWGLQ